jgi:hypothetical protein
MFELWFEMSKVEPMNGIENRYLLGFLSTEIANE